MESVKPIITVLMESAVDINVTQLGEVGEVKKQLSALAKPELSIVQVKNYSI